MFHLLSHATLSFLINVGIIDIADYYGLSRFRMRWNNSKIHCWVILLPKSKNSNFKMCLGIYKSQFIEMSQFNEPFFMI
jgi:hypothetical protein